MNTILVMSLTGSCMTICYFIGKRLLGGNASHRAYYLWLKLCLVSYIVPLMELKHWYSYGLQKIFGIYLIDIAHIYDEQQESFVFLSENDMVDMSIRYKINMILAIFWVGVMLLRFLIQLSQYEIELHRVTNRLVKEEGEYKRLVEYLKQDMKIRRNVTVYSKVEYGSFCVGLIRPYIVVSKKDDDKVSDCIFCHELVHIMRLDVIVEWFVFIMCCVHWFNPFAYFLKKELMKEMELSCDEHVIERLGEKKRDEYALLLVEQAKMKPFSLLWTQHMAAKSNKILKERVEEVMKRRTVGKVMKWVTGGVMAMAVMFSSFTVLAYEDVAELEAEEPDVTVGEEFWFLEPDDEPNIEDEVTEYSAKFVDENGNEYIEDGISQQNLCPHQFVDGYFESHTRNSSGGCVVKRYKAKKCTVCGNVVIGDLVSTTTYVTCPH